MMDRDCPCLLTTQELDYADTHSGAQIWHTNVAGHADGVSATDPVIFSLIALLLTLVAVLPGARASRCQH